VKTYQRLLLFLFIALAAATILSPWGAALSSAVFYSPPGFGQIFGGLFIAAATVLLLSNRSLLRLQFLRDAGLGPLSDGYRDVLSGFILAVASMVLLGLVMSLAGVFTPGFFHSLNASLEWAVKALLTALVVGFLEELFFRGVLFKALLDDYGPALAFTAANLFYAAVHFFKPPAKFAVNGLDPLAGARFVVQTLQPFLDPGEILPGLLGLFVIGLVLSYAVLRTNSVYLSIGLHAGWVFAIKTVRIFGEFERNDLGWLFGSSEPKIVSGVVTWIGIAVLVGGGVHLITRPHPSPLPGREREGRGS
jgi:membrane protease YdiL (CAAX protease family)